VKFHNTMTRKVEEFEPMEPGHVRMYTCGPTVYDFAHIGNFRAYMFEDILRRALKAFGFKVTQVMNLTDVDDKTIRGAISKGVGLDDYTKQFKEAFFADLDLLGIERAEEYPEATQHIPEMIELVEQLIDKGHGYKSQDGSVYFNINTLPDYGKLAHLDRENLQAGARVAQDEYDKENASDFALWKAWDEADGDVFWESPWGRGRPGWHIECSAMSMKYLGESFDIHTGGVDNIFPHHENEIAQSEGATGKPFCRYWIHSEHLIVDGGKMSKSLGNFYTIKQVLDKGYTGREVRYLLLAAHYRQSLNFTFKALDGAKATIARLDEFTDRLKEVAGTESEAADRPEWAAKEFASFMDCLGDDLNTPRALAALFNLVHAGNKAMDTMDLWINTAKEDLLAVISRVDLLTINDSESLLLTGERNIVKAARKALDLGPTYVVIKKGEHGAVLFEKEAAAQA